MVNIYLTQLIGVMLTGAGILALMASAHLFGSPLTPTDKRKASDEWNRHGNTYSLPISFSTLASIAILVGGIGILARAEFELCGFLAYWLPTLPEAIKLLLACK